MTEGRAAWPWGFEGASPSNVVILSGAGISVDGPTNGPLGAALARAALDRAFLPGTLLEVQGAYAVLGMRESRVPRLEAILEIAVSVHGTSVLSQLLEELVKAEPNALHHFFGQHVALGGQHVTANFDTLIERAVPGTRVLHFHGSLSHDGKGCDSLGATLSRVERGFNNDVRERLMEAFTGTPRRRLLVVGYSGSDYFDMDPFVEQAASAFADALVQVIWVEHDNAAPNGTFEISEDLEGAPKMLRMLADAGIEWLRLRGNTASALTVFAQMWGLDPVIPEPRRTQGHDVAEVGDWSTRALATHRLFRHMGMYRSDNELLAREPWLRERVDVEEAAEAAWQRGEHSYALAHWRRLYGGADAASRAMLRERTAACLWDRGSYLRAYWHASKAVSIASGCGNADVLALTVEMKARVLVHMARTPELRWFSTPTRRQHLVLAIDKLVGTLRMGAHVGNRLRDVRLLLEMDPEGSDRKTTSAASVRHGPPSPQGVVAGHRQVTTPAASAQSKEVESFSEYESLSAVADYSRGQMRSEAAAGLQVTAETVEQYRRAAEYLGKTAAVATLFAVPGAAPHYTLRDVMRALPQVPATPWHRVRLLGRWVVAKRRA